MHCFACDYTTERKYDFRKHLYTKRHTENETIYIKEHNKKFNYQCEKCKITFKHYDTYENHISQKTCEATKKWKCPRCKKDLAHASTYYHHINNVDCEAILSYKWKCELCDKCYKHKSSYYAHRRSCYKQNGRYLPKRKKTKWKCEICNNKVYRHYSSYLRHKKVCNIKKEVRQLIDELIEKVENK